MGLYKEHVIKCQDTGINPSSMSPFVNNLLEENVLRNGNSNKFDGRGKTGISVRNMSYDEADEIIGNFERNGPYLVELANRYVSSDQVPAVINPSNLSSKEFDQFIHLGNVVRGKAKRISRSKK